MKAESEGRKQARAWERRRKASCQLGCGRPHTHFDVTSANVATRDLRQSYAFGAAVKTSIMKIYFNVVFINTVIKHGGQALLASFSKLQGGAGSGRRATCSVGGRRGSEEAGGLLRSGRVDRQSSQR
eukprot:4377817-Pleurochrysis_carterae.AAC.1